MKTKVSLILIILLLFTGSAYAKERQGIITLKINLNVPKSSDSVRLWLPYPLSDEDQMIKDMTIEGNYNVSTIYQEPKSGAIYLYNEWTDDSDARSLEMSFKVKAQERTV